MIDGSFSSAVSAYAAVKLALFLPFDTKYFHEIRIFDTVFDGLCEFLKLFVSFCEFLSTF